jgi:putative membrane protein
MSARKGSMLVIAGLFGAAIATVVIAQDQNPRGQSPNQAQPNAGQQQNFAQPGQAQQSQTQMGQRYQTNKPVVGNEATSADFEIASCLIVDNQGEIALGKLAQDHAKDNDVKEFGERMVKDHTDFLQKLEKFAANDNRSSSSGQKLNFVQMKQQVGQKLLDMQRKELDEKQGSQFDKCYIGSQIGAHMEVLATLEVARDHVSSDLASLLDKGIETTKMHLDDAQKIAKALDRQ